MRITDKLLLKLSISAAIIGIFILYIILITTELPRISMQNIEHTKDKTQIQTAGLIQKITHINNITILQVQDTCYIEVVFYETIHIPTNTHANIAGEISTYKGKKQIIGEEIILLQNTHEKSKDNQSI